ncbi:hypothetical protein DL93DRAFT_2069690 [Clavulina sp. PMI_390]|nr:hypothetical protein DL93DRAFT_2069690 [Clavulina sp. PMI_390]
MSGVTVGVFAGALAGTAIYYSFSHSIQTSSQISRGKLKALSLQLSADPSSISPVTPLPAAARIPSKSVSNDLKQRWNSDVESLVHRARNFSVEVKWDDILNRLKDATSKS